MPGLGRQQQKSWSGLVLICLSVCIIITLLNYSLMLSAVSNNKNDMLTLSSRGDSSSQSSPLLIKLKANSINSYWWPSTESGGLLGKMYAKQNPVDCTAAKYLVWRSLPNNENDTRGLTAWAHSGTYHLLHSLTDGDQYPKFPSRVLINDDKVRLYYFIISDTYYSHLLYILCI